jgi:dihydroorotate dehydrogenase (NAD+) catalytic subunit
LRHRKYFGQFAGRIRDNGGKLLSDAGVDLIEVNISCPNVKAGGLAFGTCPSSAAEVTAAV